MPLTLLWGEEDFLIEKEINKIKTEVLGGEINELNYKTADNPDFKDLIFYLRSQPMMFGDIVINIKAEKYFLEGAKKFKLEDKETDELIEALDLISDRVHIILTCLTPRGERKKPDQRKKFYKVIAKNHTVKEFQSFKAYEEYKILPVLKDMMKEYNLKADTQTMEELIRKTGPYLRDLSGALDKISLYVYPNNVVTKKTIDFLYPASQNIFSFIDLILEKNYSKVLYEITNMLQKAHYLEILAFLQSGFSKIMYTKIYSTTMSTYDIARKTGQNEYALKMTLNKIRNISLSEILKLKKNLTMAEYEIKTGQKEPITALLEGFLK